MRASDRRRFADACIALAVFAASGWWGAAYWNASFKAGRPPVFYQEYFEPAVMVACGKGFVIAQPQGPAMEAFVFRRVDTFSCSQIPADANLGTRGLYQGAWRYLLIATGLFWRIVGISWSGMGPLFGLFFAATITIAYGILRLGMGRSPALLAAIAMSVSSLHLHNLPHLRDYSKAPFTLALIFILGLIVKARPTARALLGWAAAYGVVLGVGYGFRTDFLVNLPVFFLVVFLFTDGGLLRNLRLKAASAVLCFTLFVTMAWPIISAVYRAGGCQWHTALLGLTTDFTDSLELVEAPYDWGSPYADGFVYATATSFGRRVHPGIGHIPYCEHEYDVVTGQYLMEVARRFPADMLVRAYASTLQIARLPFARPGVALTGFAPHLYTLRGSVLAVWSDTGTIWIAAALVLISTTSVRLALCLGFLLLYFGGYPAIQFSNRHYFHLEIISWWAVGFVVYHTTRAALRWRRARATGVSMPPVNWRQAAWVMPLMLSLFVIPLAALRGYQQLTMRSFFERYLNAPADELALDTAGAPGTLHEVPIPQPADAETGEQLIVITVNASRCAERPSVTVRYDKAFPNDNFTRTLTLTQASSRLEPTRIFIPVYRHFLGVEFSDTRAGCIGGVSRVRDVTKLSLLLPSVLSPGWQHERLYQTFAKWPLAFGH